VRQAQAQADLERRKAEAEIKDELVSVSSLLAEKMLEREVNADDHKTLIEDFIRDLNEVKNDNH
jgi:F0F1-type ATP synthase membrane subunit b/b'